MLKLKNVRISYPHLFRPHSMDPDEVGKYSVCVILPKNHPQVGAVKALIRETMTKKWKGKKPPALRVFLRDGEEKAGIDGFGPDVLFFEARNNNRPSVLDRDKSPLVEGDGKPYAGCYCVVAVDAWAQDNQWGKRVNATLAGVQFMRDGDRFGGGAVATSDDFDDLSEEEEGWDDEPAEEDDWM